LGWRYGAGGAGVSIADCSAALVINDEKGVAGRELQACGLAELALFFRPAPPFRQHRVQQAEVQMAAGPRAGRGSVAEMHAWLLAPGARGIGHRGALVLVTNIGTFDRRADSYGGFEGGHPHFRRHDGPWSVVFKYTPSNTPLALRRDRGP
jgi:hypothetical protein